MVKVRLFTFEERQTIERLLKNGKPMSAIAKHLGRWSSGVRSEIIKNTSEDGIYTADFAQRRSNERQIEKSQKLMKTWNESIIRRINHGMEEGKSLSQIAWEMSINLSTLRSYLRRTNIEYENFTQKPIDIEKRLSTLESLMEIVMEYMEKKNDGN